jgi:4-alpha-glucanotransferase
VNFDRSSGVLCHVTSLPGPHGIGDLGPAAHDFLALLDAADQRHWQVLPLGPTRAAHGDSPYASPSTFAGNPLFVSLERLAERGWVDPLDPPAFPADEVDYDRVRAFKTDALRRAYDGFEAHATEAERAAFEAFRAAEDWLDDYALYAALADRFDGAPWPEWPAELRERDPGALDAARAALAEEVAYHEFVQFCFDEQWTALREAAAERGVSILGDLPIYVALDSADVWADREAFLVDEEGTPAVVAGVPPNPGDDGQRWGNPLYDWDHVARTEFDWWRRRVSRLFDLVDEARLDHFKGFHEFWAIPADADSPAAGEWVEGPGVALFDALERDHGDLPFVAEDLGFLDAGAVALRERLDVPGMRVPHYADWCEEGHMYQPMHYPRDAVGYTATHDTDTTVGYYESMDPGHRDCLHYNLGVDGSDVAWSMIDAVWGSNAVLAFTTPQDLLGLGSEARLNTPGTAEDNWDWRFREGALDDVTDRLARITDRHVR